MIQQYIQTISEIFILLIGVYLAFFKSYFQEKGKNLATLQDIEEITKKVESIKTEFIKETEKLKLDIQYTNQVKFTLKSEEIKSLLDFHDSYFLWINVLLDLYFSNYDEENYQTLKNAESNINDTYFKFLLAEAKADLFINDKELFEHARAMKLQTLEFQNHVLSSILSFSFIIQEIIQMKAMRPSEVKFGSFKELLSKKSEFIKKYNEEKIKNYKEIAQSNAKFQSLAYKLLLSMSSPTAIENSGEAIV